MAKLKTAIMISGRGTNMGALARAAINPDFPAEIVLVISNRPHVAGLELAREHGIRIRVVDHTEFESREDHEEKITEALEEAGAGMVCLAGYMRILTETFINRWRGQLINVHPSLLPAFRGIDTHERALERGCRIHGCTVHFVNTDLDAGPIIAQAAVPVLPGDDAEALSERVLAIEHELYPKALALIADRRVRWSGSDAVADMDVTVDDVALFPAPAQLQE